MFLFDLPSVWLGPWGTAVLVLLTALTSVLSWRQRGWERTANAADKELDIQRGVASRLEDENKGLRHENTTLKVKSDLTPLLECIAKLDAGMKAWTDEGRRRFDKSMQRLDIIHVEQAQAMRTMLAAMETQREQSERIFAGLVGGFDLHKGEMARVANILQSVERRLSKGEPQL